MPPEPGLRLREPPKPRPTTSTLSLGMPSFSSAMETPAPGPRMAADTAKHLATHYGSLAFDIARLANENPELGERVHPDAPEIWAQVVYARDNEWAETQDDVLRRRTTLTIRGLATDEVRAKVQDVLDKK